MISVIIELQMESRSWPVSHGYVTDMTIIWVIFYFREKDERVSGENIPGWVANVSDHPYVTSQALSPPPWMMQACPNGLPRQRQKKLRNLSLTPKYRSGQFPQNFSGSDYILFCKFCQHDVDRKHVDTCKENLQLQVWKTRKTKKRA